MIKISKATILFATTLAGVTSALAEPAYISRDVNMRNGPNIYSPIIKVLPKGARVNVYKCDRNWCRVNYGPWKGWTSAGYIAFKLTPNSSENNVFFSIGSGNFVQHWWGYDNDDRYYYNHPHRHYYHHYAPPPPRPGPPPPPRPGPPPHPNPGPIPPNINHHEAPIGPGETVLHKHRS